MDLQMPEMDGITVTSEIRKQDKFNDLPIIAMTAHAMQNELQKCLDVSMNDYFTKPIDPNALFVLLSKWLNPISVINTVTTKTLESTENLGINKDAGNISNPDTLLSELESSQVLMLKPQ
jgi:CheY-like chemotaxis protein